jgi:thiol:disulfide interchange protein
MTQIKSTEIMLTLILLATSLVHAQKPGPKPGPGEVLTPVTHKEDLYRVDAVATKEIEDALRLAVSDRKRVILIFGANWCYDCHVLDRALHEGDAGSVVRRSFLLVHVDIGEGDKNLDLVRKYKTTLDKGVPVVVVLNGDGTILYGSNDGEFEAARSMMKADLVAFLRHWSIPSR